MKIRHLKHKRQLWESYCFFNYVIQLRATTVVRVNAVQFAVAQLQGQRLDTSDDQQMEKFREDQRQFIVANTGPLVGLVKPKGRK